MDPQRDSHRLDRAVARLAEAQHGVLARGQLAALELSKTAIRTRIRRGTLVPLHRGVYAVGHRRLGIAGFRLAAVLAAGPGAVLSHRDAAALHALRPDGNRTRFEVTTAAKGSSTPRVHVYARRVLAAADVTVVDAIPVTTVARTLVDLAEVVPAHLLARALATAERLRTIDLRELKAARERVQARHGPGHANLSEALEAHGRRGAQLTRSDLEQRFLELVATAGLPVPATNVWIEGVEVDAVWHEERVAVEIDSWTFHSDRLAFGNDRVKGNHLALAGWQPLRYTHDDVVFDGGRVVRELGRALRGG